MKRTLMLRAAGLVASAFIATALAACNGTVAAATQTPAQLLSTLQVKAQKVCTVSVPFLKSMTAMKSQLSMAAQGYLVTASDKVNTACSAVTSSSTTTISTTNITAMVNEGVPALIKVIDASSMDQTAKNAAEIALTAAQLAVTAALANYVGAPVVPAAPATPPSGASAPVAASA
jgi:hypothetical protein